MDGIISASKKIRFSTYNHFGKGMSRDRFAHANILKGKKRKKEEKNKKRERREREGSKLSRGGGGSHSKLKYNKEK